MSMETTGNPVRVAPLERYLESTPVVDWRTPPLQSLAQELAAGIESDAEKAKVLFDWVRDNIPHSKDIGSEKVTCKASQVLQEKTGICYAKSHLLAALLRANGIPAGFCYQLFTREPPFTGRGIHGLNGVFLPSLTRWFRVDSRGNKEGVDAQFSLEREQLAFPDDPLFDEHVYPDPFQSVVRVLSEASSVSELWRLLPDGPE